MAQSDVPSSIRVRTDPDEGLAYRFDAIEGAAEFWDCNRTDAIVRSCDAAGQLVENVASALQHKDLSPRLASELADEISTRQVKISLEERDVTARPE